MAELHKISGYLLDIDGAYCEGEIEEYIRNWTDLIPRHFHTETADIGEWEEDNPLNYTNCDLAECEKYFKANVHKVDNNRKVKPGQIWKHFKTGKKVRILAVSQDTESVGSYSVVYVCTDGKVWHRPLGMFLSKVDHKKYPEAKQFYRFELVE